MKLTEDEELITENREKDSAAFTPSLLETSQLIGFDTDGI